MTGGQRPRGRAASLTQAGEQFRLLVEQIQDYAIFMLDPAGIVASWNSGAARIKGYQAGEIIGQHFSRFFPAADRARGRPAELLSQAAAHGRCEDEGWRVRKDGSRFWALVVITALHDEGHQLCGFAKVTRDLTERMQAQTTLRESKERLEAMMENTPALVFLKDLSGRYQYVNREFAARFGLTRDTVLGRTDLDLFPREQAEAFRANDARVLLHGVPERFEEAARYADGEHVSIVSKFPVLDAAGQASALCGIAVDITERVRTEADLRKANLVLQSIFDAAPVAVLSLDLQGRITRWSPGAERMFGWTEREALGGICPTVPEDGRADFLEMVVRVARDGAEQLVRARQKKNGQRIQAKLHAAPVRGTAGEAGGVMVILEDVTEKQQAEAALQTYSARLAALSRQLLEAQEVERRRIARELHDQVGQSLALLLFGLRALQEETGPGATVQALNRHIASLEEIFAQVRNLALELRPTLLDDLGLVPALRWHAYQAAESAGLQLAFEAQPTIKRLPPEIETACFRTVQAALSNVVRHASAHRIDLRIERMDGELVLTLRDDGVGFDPEAARLRAIRGESMGLLTMEERVKLTGGTLSLESTPGQGAVVRARFPLPRMAETRSPA